MQPAGSPTLIFMAEFAPKQAEATEDPKESTCPFQRIAIAISQGKRRQHTVALQKGLPGPSEAASNGR